MKDWLFPKLTDYWDTRVNAIDKMSEIIRHDHKDDQAVTAKEINKAITQHVSKLSDENLMKASFCMIDDLYKAANHTPVWDANIELYLNAIASSFCDLLQNRGYLIHYLVDNTFNKNLTDFGRPLKLFPDWFRAAGLVYICPQCAAMDLMKGDGLNESNYFNELPRYIKEAQHVCNAIAEKCHSENRHYVFLDVGEKPSGFKLSFDVSKQPGIITIYRSEAPVEGSKCTVVFPTKSFL